MVFFRDMNLPEGDKWYQSDSTSPTIDIAMLPFPEPDGDEAFQAGYRWVPPTMFFHEAIIGDDPNAGVGIGDDVVTLDSFPTIEGRRRMNQSSGREI